MSGGESSQPLPGSGEFLLKLLQKNPNPNPNPNQIQSNGHNFIHPPFAPHSYIQPQNPNPDLHNSDHFPKLGFFGENMLKFGSFGENSGNSRVLNGNQSDFQDSNRNRRGFSGNDADFRNSMDFSENSQNPRVLNGYDSQNLNNIVQNPRGLSGNESDFRNSMNINEIIQNPRDFQNLMNLRNGVQNPSGISGLESDFRNSINLNNNTQNPRDIENLNNSRNRRGFSGNDADFRNSMNFHNPMNFSVNETDFRNYEKWLNSSRIGEGSNRIFNGIESDYRNSPNNGNREAYIRHNEVLNGLEIDYRNSPINRSLNGLESNYRNRPDSSESDFSNFPNHVSRTSKAIQPPPGFSKKTMNKNVENSEKSSSNRRKSGSISPQLDFPPSGSALHSVSGFEIEESLSELHSEIGENGEKLKNGDSDDLDDNVVESLEREEVSSNKNQKKKRDKEYRSDTRGQRVLAQWMRKSRSMIACRTDIDIFNAPLLSIFDSLVPPEEEKMKQKQLLALLEKLVIKEWPEARLHVYGSCANSFGVKKSDIDICLAMKDTDVNKSEILLRLAGILEAENFENVQALTRARVPIVKLMDSVTGISCDICINNVLAVVNSKLLRDYAKIDARLRQLAFIVKHWAKSRGVNETYHGTLSSYAYVLMCIHFLQQCRPSILPCLQGMNITYSVSVDNVECAFFDQVDKLSGFGLRNKENIGQLVWGFFRYWAYCHDYAHNVVSVRVGSTISKRAKDWTRRVGNDRHLICIEDPFETTHDLGRVVDKFSIKVLREEFERAAEILQFDPNPCVTLFEPYVPS